MQILLKFSIIILLLTSSVFGLTFQNSTNYTVPLFDFEDLQKHEDKLGYETYQHNFNTFDRSKLESEKFKLSEISTERVILRFDDFSSRDSAVQNLLDNGVKISYIFNNIPAITVINSNLPDELEIKSIHPSYSSSYSIQASEDSQINQAEPLNTRRGTTLATSTSWLGVDYLWDQGYFGENQSIAILDTGIDGELPSFLDENDETRVTTHVVSGLSHEGTDDYRGHGTHVAGIAAGNGKYLIQDEFKETTSRGVAHKAHILSIKVLGADGFGDTAGVLEGIDYAMTQNATVISMSFGTDIYNGTTDLHIDLMEEALSRRIILIAAAGNLGFLGGSTISIPAAIPGVVAVGAFTPFINRFVPWIDSSTGPGITPSIVPKPDILAPGFEIISVNFTNGAPVLLSGTSMAVPHISGGVSLLLEAFPNASSFEIINAMYASATDLGYSVESQGRGVVNFELAYKILSGDEDVSNAFFTSSNPIAIHDATEPIFINNQVTYRRNIGNSYFFNNMAGEFKSFNVSLFSHSEVKVHPKVDYIQGNVQIDVPNVLHLQPGVNLFTVNTTMTSNKLEFNKAEIYFIENETNTMIQYSNISFFSQTKFPRGKIMFDLSKDRDTPSGYYLNDGPRGKYSIFSRLLALEGFEIAENHAVITPQTLEDVTILIISNPDLPYSGDEKIAIRDFVDNKGGGLLIFGNGGLYVSEEAPFAPFELININSFLREIGQFPHVGITFSERDLTGDGQINYNFTNLGFTTRTSTLQRIITPNIPIEFFGIDLTVDQSKATVLTYQSGFPLAAATQSGNGRIMIFGSTLPFDSHALGPGRYTTSDANQARTLVSDIVNWLNQPKELKFRYEVSGVSYDRMRDLQVSINELFTISFMGLIDPSGNNVELQENVLSAYIVHQSYPFLFGQINFTRDETGIYSTTLNLPEWGRYWLYLPYEINGVGNTDGRITIFANLANFINQDGYQTFGRIIMILIFISWIIWLRNEGGRRFKLEQEI
jgi:subtilisin family serine protease